MPRATSRCSTSSAPSAATSRSHVRTSAPRWIFDLTLTRPIDWQPLECDTGVVQIDSLRVDEARRSAARPRFYERVRRARRAREAEWLRSRRRAPRGRRYSAAGVRRGADRRRSGDRARQLHLGLDLRGLSRLDAGGSRFVERDSRGVLGRGSRAPTADAWRLRDVPPASSICRSSRGERARDPQDVQARARSAAGCAARAAVVRRIRPRKHRSRPDRRRCATTSS